MTMVSAPERAETAEYYHRYIDQVPAGDIRDVLERQLGEASSMLEAISEQQSLHRYAPGKWSIREVVAHINDTERLFTFRAFWFARALGEPLPSFDQDIAASHAGADERPWRSHLDEFHAVRAATIALFRNLPAEAWTRRGVASGNPFTVRALAYIAAGHLAHHLRILREQYLTP
jgi:DinB family protein